MDRRHLASGDRATNPGDFGAVGKGGDELEGAGLDVEMHAVASAAPVGARAVDGDGGRLSEGPIAVCGRGDDGALGRVDHHIRQQDCKFGEDVVRDQREPLIRREPTGARVGDGRSEMIGDRHELGPVSEQVPLEAETGGGQSERHLAVGVGGIGVKRS
ncbi:MAG: hypothetical protein JRI23_14985 [Deltaproteobacteria bacterium]|nr:hypothetical protein [Deltaproteobacteria bacterium]